MTRGNLRKHSILIVDEEAVTRKIITRMLKEMGCLNVYQAEDATAAAELLLKAKSPINLIILDLKITKTGGLDLLTYIRNANEISDRHILIIALTGQAEKKSDRAAVKLGVHGFLAKPVSKANLDDVIKKVLSSPPIHLRRTKP